MPDSSIAQAARLIAASRHAVALVGAGISAESGIPTFRGKDGLWTKQGEPTIDGWELFNRDPATWWQDAIARRGNDFGRAIDEAVPAAGHLAMVDLEAMGKLAHTITQNVDDLHRRAGTRSITEIHGNRYRVRCMRCNGRGPIEDVPLDRLPPQCPECGGILKNDTVMFGEPIPPDAIAECYRQTDLADLFLVIGTSAVVYPAADFPIQAKRRGAPLIEINPEETALSWMADVVVRAPAGEALTAIVAALRETARG